MNIFEKIKQELNKRNIRNIDLAENTGISLMTIQNILTGRSKKPEYIKKIANSLGLPYEYFLKEDGEEDLSHINLEAFEKAVLIVIKIINKRNININKTYLFDLIYSIYLYVLENNASEEICIAYAEGLLKRDMEAKKV